MAEIITSTGATAEAGSHKAPTVVVGSTEAPTVLELSRAEPGFLKARLHVRLDVGQATHGAGTAGLEVQLEAGFEAPVADERRTSGRVSVRESRLLRPGRAATRRPRPGR